MYIDTAKTSTLEGSATTVYADGGRGNTHLVAWEGEKTLTFTVEDALLSPIGFSILSGAGLLKQESDTEMVHVHAATTAYVESNGSTGSVKINLADALSENETIDDLAPIFVMGIEADGSVTGDIYKGFTVKNKQLEATGSTLKAGDSVLIDYYVKRAGTSVDEIQIDAGKFGGYFYVEAETLFRQQADGKDLPAIITLPNVKIQSNFTFNMAATGDPSTFSFVMDAFPGYTMFDKRKKVLCAIQVINESISTKEVTNSVFGHVDSETDNKDVKDSVANG